MQSAGDAKARGNAAYKKKDFDTAIKEYEAAIELDGSDMTFYNNMGGLLCFWIFFLQNNSYYLSWKYEKYLVNIFIEFFTAVFFEQKNFDKCINVCEKAIEIGRENRADFKLIAKAFVRIAKAYKQKEVS